VPGGATAAGSSHKVSWFGAIRIRPWPPCRPSCSAPPATRWCETRLTSQWSSGRECTRASELPHRAPLRTVTQCIDSLTYAPRGADRRAGEPAATARAAAGWRFLLIARGLRLTTSSLGTTRGSGQVRAPASRPTPPELTGCRSSASRPPTSRAPGNASAPRRHPSPRRARRTTTRAFSSSQCDLPRWATPRSPALADGRGRRSDEPSVVPTVPAPRRGPTVQAGAPKRSNP
jgi:hypothetical protein